MKIDSITVKEIMKNPSTKTKDCKSLYDKLMSAE